jgi:rSAM/selenodomain-associated transferase 2
LKVSIIIPTLNEGKIIKRTLAMVRHLAGEKEIIVVDGGSVDKTVTLASEGGDAIVISSSRGRALQMNAGASIATGDILLFLHGDSILQPSAIQSIITFCKDPLVMGGCFTLNFDDDSFLLKIISITSNFRAKYAKIFFGDQGIFIKKHVFQKLGGFPLIDLMEDWELSRTLKKTGKVGQLSDKIITSSRRFKKGGILKTVLLMHKLKLLYLIGVSPQHLKRQYHEVQ